MSNADTAAWTVSSGAERPIITRNGVEPLFYSVRSVFRLEHLDLCIIDVLGVSEKSPGSTGWTDRLSDIRVKCSFQSLKQTTSNDRLLSGNHQPMRDQS